MMYNTPKSVIDSISKIMNESNAKHEEVKNALEGKLQLEAMKKMKMEYVVPEEIEKEGVSHFMGAAAAAHKAGQTHFTFGGKKYPVKIKSHIAKQVNEKADRIDEISGSTALKAMGKALGKAQQAGDRGDDKEDNKRMDQSRKFAQYAKKKYQKEEVKQVEEAAKEPKKVLKAGFWDTIKRAMSGSNPMNPSATYGSTTYQTTRREEKDTPGQEHMCAVHVKHAKLGEGKTLTTQHAAPTEDGSIEWYDVMFEHGIEKKVPTSELEILEAKSHKH